MSQVGSGQRPNGAFGENFCANPEISVILQPCWVLPQEGCVRLRVKMSRLKSRFSEFLRDSDGSATIEFLLWMPLLTLIISLSADTALYFGYKATVLRIVGDANRAASIGRLISEEATVSFVTDRLGDYGDVATVTVVMDDGLVVTTVTIPTSEITSTGILQGLNVDSLVVQSHQLMET